MARDEQYKKMKRISWAKPTTTALNYAQTRTGSFAAPLAPLYEEESVRLQPENTAYDDTNERKNEQKNREECVRERRNRGDGCSRGKERDTPREKEIVERRTYCIEEFLLQSSIECAPATGAPFPSLRFFRCSLHQRGCFPAIALVKNE